MLNEVEIVIRLAVAVALGGMIGLERERLHVGFRTYSAGFRTHILVCVGAALAMIVSEGIHFQFKGDAGRIAAQVVSGIGFLGAGAILREGLLVRGLTTAASLWVVAAIGLASGAGYFLAASVTTFLVLFALVILGTIEDNVRRKRKLDTLRILFDARVEDIAHIGSILEQYPATIKRVEIKNIEDCKKSLAEIYLKVPPDVNTLDLMRELSLLPGIEKVEHEG